MYFQGSSGFLLIYIFSHQNSSFKWKLTLSPLEKSPLPSWSRTCVACRMLTNPVSDHWCLPRLCKDPCSLQKNKPSDEKSVPGVPPCSLWVCHSLKNQNRAINNSQIRQNISQCNTASKGASVYPSVTWVFLVNLSATFSLEMRK